MGKLKTEIKIQITGERPMSKEGLMKWPAHLRRYVRKVVYPPELTILVPVEQISNEKKLAAFVNEAVGEGTWLVKGLTRAKTKTHVKWVQLARIIIMQKGEKWSYRISGTWRLSRYWFYNKDKRARG